LALSFHAVFEGLAVGLEEDTQDVWALFTGRRSSKMDSQDVWALFTGRRSSKMDSQDVWAQN
jgi:hypothetical protein